MRIPDSNPDFPKLELEVSEWWESKSINQKYREKNNGSDKKFKFLDGPITANNPMGVHHAHGRTIKDFFQRFKNMQGYEQRFQNGFDCQGLWVEVEEEKDLGFNSKKDIEDFGLAKFSESCANRVRKFSEVQTNQSKRLGMFMDWDDSYYTMSERNNLHIWHFLKEVDKRGWLYKGVDAMPWCVRCGTAISQHELSDGGYKDVNHESVYVGFPVTSHVNQIISSNFTLEKDQPIQLLIWTTTPWTLLANIAVAINPEIEYSLIDTGDRYVIVASDRRSILEDPGSLEGTFIGNELINMFEDYELAIYDGPFDELVAPQGVVHKLIAWDEVSADDGSGLVHIAPGAGKEDFELHKELDLDLLAPIDEFGNYVDGYGDFTGENVMDVRGRILNSLKEKGYFYKIQQIHHSYPHCWRCKHELVFRTTSEWFIKADEIREKMKAASETVNWIPEYAGKRMQDWLDNMGDWPISRKRYWGLALPFYMSEDGDEYYVVGSKEELQELAVEPDKVANLEDLHRPWIDEIQIKSPKTGNILTRVPDVGDCWLDAGIVPFSTVDYLGDKENWEKWYPFDFITEYVPQIKLWFYATLFMSVTLEGKAPWQNVLATGFLVDEKGDAMHKSAGNAIPFDEAAEQAGSDAIRWLYLRERPANHYGTDNLRFGYTVLNDVQRRFLRIFWNTYRFFVQNAKMDGWDPKEFKPSQEKEHVLDRWILSRLNTVVAGATEALENYDSTTAASLIETFIVQDYSQWYVRRSRDRVGPTVTDGQDKEMFYNTSYEVLTTSLRLLAPFVPFITEEMYQNLKVADDPESIHLTGWPSVDEDAIDEKLELGMEQIRSDAEQIHSIRKREKLPVRQPLGEATIVNLESDQEALATVLKEEINVQHIEVKENTNKEGSAREVDLDTTVTDFLRQAGVVREIVRNLQAMRREAKYEFDQRVKIGIQTESDHARDFIAESAELFQQKLLADELLFEAIDMPDVKQEISVDGEVAMVFLKKV